MLQVELRLYRRSRTAADVLQQPCHFVYILRCDWSASLGPQGLAANAARGVGKKCADRGHSTGIWWNDLPQTYIVRRRWADIVKFHEALEDELTLDSATGFRRTKTPPPELPAKGDLDAFLHGVAATGDACSLTRAKGGAKTQEEMDASEELSDLKTIYVENRLMPYFNDVNKVLKEIPTKVLLESVAFRRFVTGRQKNKVQDEEKHLKPFFGPRPLLLDADETTAAARLVRKQNPSLSALPRPVTEPGRKKTEKNQPKRAATAPQPQIPLSPTTTSPIRTSPRTPPAKSGSAPSLGLGSVGRIENPSLNRRNRHRPQEISTEDDDDDEEKPQRGWTLVLNDSGELNMEYEDDGRDPEEKERRLISSHYGFFARSLPSQAFAEFGHASGRGFWKKMVAKERREMGRRTMLKSQNDETSMYSLHKRLPSLPTASLTDLSLSSRGRSRPSTREKCKMTPSILELSRAKYGGPNEEKRLEMRENIRVGMRVIVLKKSIEDDAANKKATGEEVTKEEALKVYFKYQELLEMDAGNEEVADDADACGKDPDDVIEEVTWAMPRKSKIGEDEHWMSNKKSRKSFAAEQGFKKELMPIGWATFSLWVQREYDFASHFRYKAVCSALMRAFKRWREWEASPAQRFYGVTLSMMFQWMFPSLGYDDMAQLFVWIAWHELERIRQPTPRVIEPEEQRHLESMFQAMDPTGRGYITAEDIAGGSKDMDQRLNKNVVDADTVKLVCGDQPMTQQTFLEMMCEDNARAYENSKVAILCAANENIYGSGMQIQKLVEVSHPVVSFTGWMHDPTPKEEETPRRLIQAIEDEVSRWRKLSHSRRSRLADLHSEGHVFS